MYCCIVHVFFSNWHYKVQFDVFLKQCKISFMFFIDLLSVSFMLVRFIGWIKLYLCRWAIEQSC